MDKPRRFEQREVTGFDTSQSGVLGVSQGKDVLRRDPLQQQTRHAVGSANSRVLQRILQFALKPGRVSSARMSHARGVLHRSSRHPMVMTVPRWRSERPTRISAPDCRILGEHHFFHYHPPRCAALGGR